MPKITWLRLLADRTPESRVEWPDTRARAQMPRGETYTETDRQREREGDRERREGEKIISLNRGERKTEKKGKEDDITMRRKADGEN